MKVVTSLVIVMGIGWIGNIVLFNNDSRVIAYIMSGFIASQGVFIFILLVPLSKQVCCGTITTTSHNICSNLIRYEMLTLTGGEKFGHDFLPGMVVFQLNPLQ